MCLPIFVYGRSYEDEPNTCLLCLLTLSAKLFDFLYYILVLFVLSKPFSLASVVVYTTVYFVTRSWKKAKYWVSIVVLVTMIMTTMTVG